MDGCMEVRAVAKFVRVQPRKVRIVAREVYGQPAVFAAARLSYHPSKGAFLLRKVLVSAVANAVENHGANPDRLKISRILIDEGPHLKRYTQKAMGRGARVMKKMSHITVYVEDFEPAEAVKPHGTKAKARPKLEARRKSKAQKAAAPVETPVEDVVTEATEPEVDAIGGDADLHGEQAEEVVDESTELEAQAEASTEEADPEVAEEPAPEPTAEEAAPTEEEQN